MALIYYLTQIQFEFGAIQLLQQECARAGITRPLIVTDPGVKAAGILQKALDALPGMTVAVFDQTPSNPTEAAVRAATAVFTAQHCDGLIGVGGGSPLDCAKGVAIAATHTGPLSRYATIEGGSPLITDVGTRLLVPALSALADMAAGRRPMGARGSAAQAATSVPEVRHRTSTSTVTRSRCPTHACAGRSNPC